ncbi:MAG: outer membrane beta-barrel protein [Bacteroidota bacterium]
MLILSSLFIFGNLDTAQAQRAWQYESKRGGNHNLYTKNISNRLMRDRARLLKPLTFGFFLAPLTSNYRAKFSDEFVQDGTFTPEGLNAPLISVEEQAAPSFAVGFYANLRLSEFWDFRVHTNASFYERKLVYTLATGEVITKVVESPMFELPLLFKYRSQLRGIKGMYLIGGVKPAFVLSRRTEEETNIRPLSADLSLEYGMGFDIFFSFFKFAPEIRFSHGLINVLDRDEVNAFSVPLQRLSTNTFTLYLHFGG